MTPREDACVTELAPVSPCGDLLPLQVGDMTLAELDLGRLTLVAPYAGQVEATSDALQSAHGVGFPDPGEALRGQNTLCLWCGRVQALLAGPEPDAALASHAALTDQSDGWAVVRLSGAGATDALARLVPIDLRPGAFPPGSAARTLLGHMTVTILRDPADVAEPAFTILAFRSMATTLVHELETAMRRVAARAEAG